MLLHTGGTDAFDVYFRHDAAHMRELFSQVLTHMESLPTLTELLGLSRRCTEVRCKCVKLCGCMCKCVRQARAKHLGVGDPFGEPAHSD